MIFGKIFSASQFSIRTIGLAIVLSLALGACSSPSSLGSSLPSDGKVYEIGGGKGDEALVALLASEIVALEKNYPLPEGYAPNAPKVEKFIRENWLKSENKILIDEPFLESYSAIESLCMWQDSLLTETKSEKLKIDGEDFLNFLDSNADILNHDRDQYMKSVSELIMGDASEMRADYEANNCGAHV